MKSKPRILEITSSSSFGGGPKHLYDLVLNSNKNLEMHIACPQSGIYWDRFNALVEGRTVCIPNRSLTIGAIFKLFFYIKKNSINLIHTHGKGAGAYGRILALLCRVPLVHTPHGIHLNGNSWLKRNIYLVYELLTKNINSKTIFVSNSEKEFALSLGIVGNGGGAVVFNGVSNIDSQIYTARDKLNLRKKLFIPDGKVIVVTLSRFDYAKNMSEMLKIAAQCPEVNFLIIGDGPDYQTLVGEKIRLGLKNVQLPGFMDNPIEALIASDIYLSTSRWEGLPLAILEAMSVGLPIIASDVIGNKDAVVQNLTGYLYKLGDIHKAVEKINYLAKNYSKRVSMGIDGKKRQREYFSDDGMARKNNAIYLEIINSKKVLVS